MSDEVLQQFISTSEDLNSNKISIEEATRQIQHLDFDSLSLDEIKVVEDSDWIPDDLYVKIIRSWTNNQDRNINYIISYLTMTNSIGKAQMLSFVDAVFKPKNALSLEVENIIEKIATGGGNREFVNPVKLKLITAMTDDEIPTETLKLHNLFSGDPTKRFQSKAKPKASFRISFPSYMKIIPRSYKLTAPSQMKGPKTWALQAKTDQEGWIDISTEKNSPILNSRGAEGVFQINPQTNTAYSSFQFVLLDQTHENNYSLALSSFDISGIVILKSNRRY